MRCRIADLIVELTAAGGMASRCADYRTNGDEPADVVIRSEEFLEVSRPWDVHPTVIGHKLIAQVLCEYLEAL